MPPAACIAAAAEITATMISIALIGGSPGSSPKRKTRTSVPTPPQSPSPMPPERTPRAMKPITTSALERDQDPVGRAHLARLLSQLLARARVAERSGELGVEARDLDDASARRWRARPRSFAAASVSCSIDSSSVSASSSSESCAPRARSRPSRPSRRPARPPPRPPRCRGCRRCRRPRPASRSPARPARGPCGRSPSGPAASPTAAPRRRAAMALGRPDVLDDRLDLAPPDADGAAHALRPLAGGDGLAARRRGCRSDAVTPSTSTTPTAMPTIQVSGPRIARPTSSPDRTARRRRATSSCQKRSTVGMLTRSSGECGNSICGPNDSMSRRRRPCCR